MTPEHHLFIPIRIFLVLSAFTSCENFIVASLTPQKGESELGFSSNLISSRFPRVSGGRVARPNEFPYMAAIFIRVPNTPVFAFTCGGSIYNRKYITTAGHCLHLKGRRVPAKDFRVIVGQKKIRLRYREDAKELIPVTETFIHDGFDTSGRYYVLNDIALMKLDQSLNYTRSIRKLRIASANESPIDGIGDVVGWGRSEVYFPHTSPSRDGNDLPHSLDLKVARLRILPSVLCTIRHVTIMPSTVLCVGSEGLLDTQSACYGDSGGPLACRGPSGPYLCGIVSTGAGCGLRFTPAFYTKLSHESYSSWFRKIGGIQT